MPELSDLQLIISRLQKTIDEELNNISALKNKCAKESEFEMAASVRDFEKRILAFRESLGA
jgi:excinuclease UvrABC nuclease subunit